ncbi:MAG: DUF4493 domain-containing protein [Muribaculaceae bacterium]|nr:DUF4493 domain-containing protein [Muribaculaceae bacterium]
MTNKVTKYLISLLGSVALLLSSCAENSQQILLEDDFGTLSLTGLNIEINGFSSVSSRAIEVDYDKFIIEIYSDGQTVPVIEPITYSQALSMETISLPVGVYHAVVKGGSGAQSAFDDPYYEGESEPFAIESKKITVVPVIECELLSLAVRVVIDDKLLEMIDNLNQTSVEAYNDVENSLTFGKDQFRYGNSTGADGYFLDNGNALITLFNTVIGDNEVTMQYNIPNAKKGTLYIITYSATGSGIKPNPGTGTPSAGFTIDVTVTQQPLIDLVFQGEDEKPFEGGIVRPGDDDNTDQIPENPSNPDDNPGNQPGGNTNTIQINQSSDFTPGSNGVITIKDNGVYEVNISSDYIIESLIIEISTEDDDFDEIVQAGLTKFDLLDPGADLEELFGTLKFPCGEQLRGEKEIKVELTYLISQLLSGFKGGNHTFKLTVYDAGGFTKEITFVFHA